jgi:hypothetical protein
VLRKNHRWSQGHALKPESKTEDLRINRTKEEDLGNNKEQKRWGRLKAFWKEYQKDTHTVFE